MPEEESEKLRRLVSLMEDKELEAVAVCSYQNVAYFGGTYLITQTLVPDRQAFFVLRRDGRPALVVCNLEESLVRSQTKIDDVRPYVEFAQHPTDVLAEVLTGLASGRVGVDARRLPVDGLRALEGKMPGLELVAIDQELEDLQMVKSGEEVGSLKAAAQSTQAAIEDAIAHCAVGSSELDIAAAITRELILAGGSPAFLVLGSGARSMIGHADPRPEVIEEGRIFRVDTGARFANGIMSDLARTGVVGEASPSQKEYLDALLEIQRSVFAHVEPGRPARELYEAQKRGFEAHGLPFEVPHIGHGLGIGLHESPILQPGNNTPLERGMVLAIEPFVIVRDRSEGYHIEDVVLVTDDGYELLTTPQTELLRLGADTGDSQRELSGEDVQFLGNLQGMRLQPEDVEGVRAAYVVHRESLRALDELNLLDVEPIVHFDPRWR